MVAGANSCNGIPFFSFVVQPRAIEYLTLLPHHTDCTMMYRYAIRKNLE